MKAKILFKIALVFTVAPMITFLVCTYASEWFIKLLFSSLWGVFIGYMFYKWITKGTREATKIRDMDIAIIQSYFDRFDTRIEVLEQSAATQAIEIAELRALIKQDIELLENDNREIHAKLENRNALPAFGMTVEFENNLIKERYQMREDIRAFVEFWQFDRSIPEHPNCPNSLEYILGYQNAIKDFLKMDEYKNLKRHVDE